MKVLEKIIYTVVNYRPRRKQVQQQIETLAADKARRGGCLSSAEPKQAAGEEGAGLKPPFSCVLMTETLSNVSHLALAVTGVFTRS